MKFLVTGCAGFLGINLIRYLYSKGHEICSYDIVQFDYPDMNDKIDIITGDIRNKILVEKSLAGIGIVVHTAAALPLYKSEDIFSTDIDGTKNLLDASEKNKVKRFHHISTDEVYGSLKLKDTNTFNERTNYSPRSPYAASKAGSDHLVRAYYSTYGLPITISNCSNNFGPYQFPEKFVPLSITNLLENKKIPVYGDGLYVRDWLYVEDHCRAIDLILDKGKEGETYCVGGLTEDINNMEVIKKILDILGKGEEMIEFVKDRPGHDRRYALDWSKIKDELGWKPLYGFDEWLKKTVDWYKENQDWWKRVKLGEYKNYYKKQYGTE